MKKKLLFIFNPHSGKGLIKNKLLEIVDIMVKADYEVTIYPTQSKGDAQNHVREEAKNYDLIVCSGGDGTLDEAVSGMMESEEKTLLGYIPAGSTNDFANSLRIPKSMLKAANVAVKGRRFPVDIGYFNGDSFVYVAAFGLFTAVSYQTSQQLKNVLGHAAYILEGMKQLLDIPVYKMRVEYDDEVLEGITVPLSAVVFDNNLNSKIVFIYNPSTQKVELRKVSDEGIIVGRNDLIVSGNIEPGEQVVSAGASYLVDGQQVKILTE